MRNVSMTTLRSCIMGMQSCSRQLRSPSFASFSMRTWWTCRVGVGLLISPLSYIYYFYTDLGCTFPTLTPIISSISALAQKWNKNAGLHILTICEKETPAMPASRSRHCARSRSPQPSRSSSSAVVALNWNMTRVGHVGQARVSVRLTWRT